jgi:membrane protein DedA with SNARE-associated domain
VQDFVTFIIGFVREHESLALPIIFLVAFGESFCFFSVIWPGTAILVGIAALLAASGISSAIVIPAIITAALGGIVGYALSYWIGLYFKDSIDSVPPFRSRPDLIQKGELFFRRYGALSVFIGHFFGPIRAVIPVVAGMFAMRQIPFQIANITSAVLWSAGVIGPAFYLVTFQDQVFDFLLNHQVVVASVMFAVAVAIAIPHSLISLPLLFGFAGLGLLHLIAGGDFWPIWIAGIAGAFAGDVITYWLGKTRRDDLLTLRFLNGNTGAVDDARRRIASDGALAIVSSKAGPVARSVVPMLAGAVSMPLAKFTVASLFSCMLWATVLLSPYLIAYLLGWTGHP